MSFFEEFGVASLGLLAVLVVVAVAIALGVGALMTYVTAAFA